MKNRKLLIGVVLVVAILLLGIGYAAISDVELTISGNVVASPSDANFVVKFTGTPKAEAGVGSGKGTAAIKDDKNATLEVSELTAAGDTVVATYTVLNDSPDLSAKITVTASEAVNTSYFDVTTTVVPETVAKKGTATVTVTVKLLQTPVESDVTSKFTVTLNAEPVQP